MYSVHLWNAINQVVLFYALKKVYVACCVLNLYDLSRKTTIAFHYMRLFFSKYFLQNFSTWKSSLFILISYHVSLQRMQMGNEHSNAFFLLRPSSYHEAWLVISGLHYLKCALLTLWESSLTSKPLWACWVIPLCINNALNFISETVITFNKLYRLLSLK